MDILFHVLIYAGLLAAAILVGAALAVALCVALLLVVSFVVHLWSRWFWKKNPTSTP